MAKTIHILFLLTLASLSACVIPGAHEELASLKLQANDSLFHVQQGNFDFRIIMPKDLMITNEPEFILGQNGEQLTIRCGHDFNITVRKQQTSTIDLAAEQSKDQLFTYQVLDKEDVSVVFSRQLPDGSIYDYRLIQYLKFGEDAYAFETARDTAFDLQQVLRMRSALASVQFE